MKDLTQLPDNLPVPVDDGACDHLSNMRFPSLLIKSTSDRKVDLSKEKGVVVVFFYPMIGDPESQPLEGWNDIPGARGCTPQTCSYRDHYDQLIDLGVKVFGISSQSMVGQRSAVDRLNLPYELLNDSDFNLTDTLKLPTFEYRDKKFIKRVTLVNIDGVIRKVFYPVFPPDKNVGDVISWVQGV